MTNGGKKSSGDAEIIYIDNAATTFPKAERVYSAADEFYRRYGGNAGRGGNPLARACARLLAETRERLAAWLDAPSPEQVIFTSSATHALNLAILGTDLRPGDAVYVTPFEHNSVLRPIEHLRQTQGIEVRQIPFSRRTYACQLEELEAAFQVDPPALVCVTQASNVCGLMPPIVDIARLARRVNSRVVIIIDGAQTAGLYPLQLADGLIDVFIFSGHKSLYGPYGIAGLVLGSDWRPTPILFGGTGTQSESVLMPDVLPYAYEAGSHNVYAIAGLKEALIWLSEIGRERITSHIRSVASEARHALKDISDLTMYIPGQDDYWVPIISLNINGIPPQSIEALLGSKQISVRSGLHWAPLTHRWLDTLESGGSVRVSPGYFNSIEDIQALVGAIHNI
jgi:cysteine desulfurase family protein